MYSTRHFIKGSTARNHAVTSITPHQGGSFPRWWRNESLQYPSSVHISLRLTVKLRTKKNDQCETTMVSQSLKVKSEKYSIPVKVINSDEIRRNLGMPNYYYLLKILVFLAFVIISGTQNEFLLLAISLFLNCVVPTY